MTFIKANLLAKWHLPDLLPHYYNLKKKSDAGEILNKALRTSAIKLKVLSNNSLAYIILIYLDTYTEATFRQYLEAFFNLEIKKPDDFSMNEIRTALNRYPQNTEENPTVKEYITFALKNPNLLGFTISNITWYLDNNNIEARQKRQINEQKEYNIQVDNVERQVETIFSNIGRNSQNIYKTFLDNGYPSLSETVALIRISLYLNSFDNGNDVMVLNYEAFKSLLYTYTSKDCLSFANATVKLLKKKPKQPRERHFSDDDDDFSGYNRSWRDMDYW